MSLSIFSFFSVVMLDQCIVFKYYCFHVMFFILLTLYLQFIHHDIRGDGWDETFHRWLCYFCFESFSSLKIYPKTYNNFLLSCIQNAKWYLLKRLNLAWISSREMHVAPHPVLLQFFCVFIFLVEVTELLFQWRRSVFPPQLW